MFYICLYNIYNIYCSTFCSEYKQIYSQNQKNEIFPQNLVILYLESLTTIQTKIRHKKYCFTNLFPIKFSENPIGPLVCPNRPPPLDLPLLVQTPPCPLPTQKN